MGEAEDRGVARRIAARTQIRDVRLIKSSVELEAVPVDGRSFTYQIEVTDTEVDWQVGQPLFAVRCAYRLLISQLAVVDDGDDDGPSEVEKDIAAIEFTMAGLFQLRMREGEEQPSDEELSAYASTTGTFALYPFAREYVYDVTGRLRLPSLTLPVRIIELTEDEPVQ
jgi:hypothetical protein